MNYRHHSHRKAHAVFRSSIFRLLFAILPGLFACATLYGQGVTTGAIHGLVTDAQARPVNSANVYAFHHPTGTLYQTPVRPGGAYDFANVRPGGPYTLVVLRQGSRAHVARNVFISLGQRLRVNFKLNEGNFARDMDRVAVDTDEIFSSERTGAATNIQIGQLSALPALERSTANLDRFEPRSDGNFAFLGRNWFFNNYSLDGSYFGNAFGLDHPFAGGQSNAQPVAFDAIGQFRIAIAPFDVRQAGFTGGGVSAVSRGGDNRFRGSAYHYLRNETLVGDRVDGEPVSNPDLSFNQAGFTVSGPLQQNKVFFFISGELQRRTDPGTAFVAARPGLSGPGVARVEASVLQQIRDRMLETYLYDTGPFEGYTHATNNEKLLARLDWNADPRNRLTIRYNFLNAKRELPADPYSLTIANAGRGPNQNSLPFRNTGYAMQNNLNSIALELNSNYGRYDNRFFLSYGRFRDSRDPFSRSFPTIEIAVDGITYTTIGHEPFSIRNRVSQDIWQVSNDLTLFKGQQALTFGINFEAFSFQNAFNLFSYGDFFLPARAGGTYFRSLDEFFAYTDPDSAIFRDFNEEVRQDLLNPFSSNALDVGQISVYFQDEYAVSQRLSLTGALRMDLPIYFSGLPENTFSQSLLLLDQERNLETLDAGDLPAVKVLLSPRIGFNWDIWGDSSTRVRGGTGIFTGRLPFIWIANTVSNQGPDASFPSLSINAVDSDFKWPQLWTTDFAFDKRLPWDVLSTVEMIYGKDINAVFIRNADLVTPVRSLPTDGRPYYGGAGNNKLNPDFAGGVYVLDNSSAGHLFSLTAQLRKQFDFGLNTFLSYSFLESKSLMNLPQAVDDRQLLSQFGTRNSFIWQNNPVQGNPDKPEVAASEFGNQHRFLAGGLLSKSWSQNFRTHIGVFFELANGAASTGFNRSRFSYTYVGDVNGDGSASNDLIYVPRNAAEIALAPIMDENGQLVSSPEQQWADLNAFIARDAYLSAHRGEIVERNGGISPWFSNVDLRILQDFSIQAGSQTHTFQLSFDIFNLGNLLNSSWGTRELARTANLSPLRFTNQFNGDDDPIFQFTGASADASAGTFATDPGIASRWRAQVGLKYFFN